MTENSGNLKPILEIIAGVLAPITVITALLYYFGWVRTSAIFSHFGVDQRILAYSVDDYLLRSAGVAFRPLAFVLIGAGILTAIWYGLLIHLAKRPNLVRPVAVLLFAVTTGLLVYGITVLFGLLQVRKPLWAAVALALGVIAAELAFSLLDRLAAPPRNRTALALGAPPSNKTILARRLLIGAGLLLALFWSTAVYAQLSGERLAAAWANDPRGRPGVTILSEKDLKLANRGIVVTRLSSVDEGFEYRYEGFRLLIYSNSRWFLFPDNWKSDPLATVIVLRDEPTVRVEVRVDR